MDIRLPDGRILKNVPEGTTKAQIEAKLGLQAKPQEVSRETVTQGSEPLSYKDMMKDSLLNVGKGFLAGGPMGGMMSAVGEGGKNLDTLTQRGGYKAGGGVTDFLAPHVSPEIAGGAGYLTNVGVQSIPALLGAFLGGRTGKEVGEKSGKYIMQSALKPDKASRMSGEADKAIQTMLDKGINVTSGGEAKLQGFIADLNSQIKSQLSNSTAVVNKSKPAAEVLDTIKQFRNQVNPSSDIKSISNSWGEFNRTMPNSFPVQKAQDLKTGTYKMLKNKAFGELKGADIESQKALARGLKKAIEDAVPGIGSLNKQEGDLINALKLVESRVSQGGNNNLTGLAGAAMNPQSMAMMLADRSSLVKSLLARLLNSSGGATGTALGGAGGALLGNELAQP